MLSSRDCAMLTLPRCLQIINIVVALILFGPRSIRQKALLVKFCQQRV